MGRLNKGHPSPGVREPAAGRSARGPAYLVLCAMLALVAVLLVGRYFTLSPAPPSTGARGTIPAATAGPAQSSTAVPADPTPKSPAPGSATKKPAAAPQPFHLPASAPVSVRVPSIGVRSDLLRVGLNTDGTIQVPTTAARAAWYRLGITPGALGPAVILGHVDSNQGPGVFFNLGALRPGQTIDVTLADKSVAHFRIDAVDSYLKDQFPTQAVYGPIDYAGLRLITCGGQYNHKIHHYESNTVVFASLIRS